MSNRILVVDDDPHLLAAIQRTHGRRFFVHTACGGPEGLHALERGGPFAVVVADHHMPVVDGLELLDEVRRAWPDTSRIMLTGQTDLQAAMSAVNRGHVFRFLTKPCSAQDLAAALDAGSEQYRLRRSERELLDRTLNGAIQLCVDVLSLANPSAFARARRLHRYVIRLVRHLGLVNRWQYEIAALLSQIGSIALPSRAARKLADGSPLDDVERLMIERQPLLARDVLQNIPRLDIVARILESVSTPGALDCHVPSEVLVGTRLLAAAMEFDDLLQAGVDPVGAVASMRDRQAQFDGSVLAALEMLQDPLDELHERVVPYESLEDGWYLASDVVTSTGEVIAHRGQEITGCLRVRFENHVQVGELDERSEFRIVETALQAMA